eukprot:CAMPEP_0183337722 /NCGR_PEP_ID=MMETSP0164_2-20130417/5260_1 /TAXON_ID=221442 /ORGANISM="Coccolithus pelagicus ssp braarudi, Strain PLY182g" /LENGTH=49 /DNA_ID=CAMNT_0025507453 /DNA_START=98 /DNA_END=247 /DNA_ORIENTATION=-
MSAICLGRDWGVSGTRPEVCESYESPLAGRMDVYRVSVVSVLMCQYVRT